MNILSAFSLAYKPSLAHPKAEAFVRKVYGLSQDGIPAWQKWIIGGIVTLIMMPLARKGLIKMRQSDLDKATKDSKEVMDEVSDINKVLSCVHVVADWFGYASSPPTSEY